MRLLMTLAGVTVLGLAAGACATIDGYASACQRDYERNRQYATASGAALGAAAGAAIAGEGNRERGAAIGALAGGLLGNQLSERDDPCGYGFSGYNRDGRYGYTRVPGRYDYPRFY